MRELSLKDTFAIVAKFNQKPCEEAWEWVQGVVDTGNCQTGKQLWERMPIHPEGNNWRDWVVWQLCLLKMPQEIGHCRCEACNPELFEYYQAQRGMGFPWEGITKLLEDLGL